MELRGAGACSRQVNNFCTPAAFETDKLIAVEVLTPAGNWSWYPPHKHDADRPGESVLEEIYYFELSDGGTGPGVGFHRGYGTAARPADSWCQVRSGDVVLVPHGWHGPSMAPPGYDLYYLNVMAGPAPSAPGASATTPATRGSAAPGTAAVDPGLLPPLPARPAGEAPWPHRRLTVGQAVVRFLAAQFERAGRDRARLFEGCFGIFGHGNVAGLGQALLEAELSRPGRCRSTRAATSRRWSTRPPASRGCATGCRRWPAPPRSGRARRTW